MPSTDAYAAFSPSPSTPARRLEALTPNDGADLGRVAKALFIGAPGDLKITPAGASDGEAVTLKDHPAGYVPVQVRRLHASGTTAGHIVGLFD